jgi:hypothetical protein
MVPNNAAEGKMLCAHVYFGLSWRMQLLHCPTKISRGYKVIWLNRNILVSSQKDQEGRTEVEPK